ncbi:MAG: hypothetical protein SynsKO_08930 [Synoicihabitans sp.]
MSASDLNTSAAPLTSHPSFPWETVDTGSGMATSISGFTSISDAISTEAARLTYAFNNLELTTYSGGGPGDSLEIYTPKAGSTFTFAYDGTTIATGQVVSLTVNTNFTTGAATGLGTVNLISGGTNPAFFNEIGTLTGGTNIMDFAISSFTAVNASGDFTSTGTFSVSAVPEPSTYAAVLGLTALGFVHGRRRGPRRKSSPAPAPSQSA